MAEVKEPKIDVSKLSENDKVLYDAMGDKDFAIWMRVKKSENQKELKATAKANTAAKLKENPEYQKLVTKVWAIEDKTLAECQEELGLKVEPADED